MQSATRPKLLPSESPSCDLLLASVTDYAIFSVGLDERIASWNPGVKRILGFDADEFVGRPFALLFTPEDRAAGIPEREIRDARFFGRAAGRREYRREDGTRVVVEGILTPILDAGEIIGFAEVLRDDTQQQRLLEEVTLRAAELDAIFESIPDGLYVGDLSGIRDCNARGLEMLGFEHREQLNRRVGEVARDIETRLADTDELMCEEQQPFVRALAGEQVVEEVKTRNVRTGKITIVRSAASPIWKDGIVAGAVAINTDITEQRRAEKERARLLADERAARLEAEAREKDYRFLAESIPEIVWTVNREGVSQYYNLRWYAYTGLSASESVLRPWHQVVAPDQFEAFLEQWTAALNSGATFEMELRLRNSEGVYCWHLCRALPQRESDGTVTRWTGVCTNIDAQKRSEKALHQAAKMESIGVLAGGIAHDFNNLLTGVIGNTTLALEMLGESDPTAPMLLSAVRAAQSAAHLTRQLLAYAGKGHFVSRRIQMAELIETTVALMRSSISPGVHLRVHASEDLPFVDADPLQVQQIAMNVIMNAAESIPSGAKGSVDITIGTRRLSGPSIADENHRFAIEPGDFISLAVEDSGAGMTPATLSRIFEPFFTTKFTGRGLGLAAAIGIVRSYKGAILARSEFGHGSRFEILLPASRTGQVDRGKPDTAVALERRGTVLVVDDQETVRSVAQRMLKAEGFEVLTAENGAEAIEIFSARQSDISVVLLDLTMPGMSGSEVLSHLRKIDPAVRVILSSGFDKSAVLTQFAPKELAGFLQKPFTSRQIMEQIAKALQS